MRDLHYKRWLITKSWLISFQEFEFEGISLDRNPTTDLEDHWHLCGEFTGTGEFPAQMFPFDDVIMWRSRFYTAVLWLITQIEADDLSPWTHKQLIHNLMKSQSSQKKV